MNTKNHTIAPVTAQRYEKDRTAEETAAAFRGLRELATNCGLTSNRHDRVIVLIHACIAYGFNTPSRITGALAKLGYDKQHVGMTLHNGTGEDPVRHRWNRGGDGRYHSLPGTI